VALEMHEGFLPFHGYKIWYQIVGTSEEDNKAPLLCLHGGPGVPHDYLEPLAGIAKTGRRVIFYDQLGCGNSDQPSNPKLWTIPLFVAEVDAVRTALELDNVHLLGQSWGGMLAQEYMFTMPKGIASLILASTLSSARQWAAEADKLRAELPPEVEAALRRHEAAGSTDSSEYQALMEGYYNRHVCRTVPQPDCVRRAFEKLARNPEVYHTMWGPSEFTPTGTIADWDVTSRLGEIDTPTLITSGLFDESTPAIAKTLLEGIPGSEWVVFEQSAHLAHAEEPDRYIKVVDEFLTRVEARRGL
jgi:proline-specific peptidase